jgi:hypothetical protein
VLGFEVSESFSGSYYRLDEPRDCAMELKLRISVQGLRRFLRDRKARVDGTIIAEDLATAAALRGVIRLRLIDEKRIPYDLEFTGDDGKRYRVRGQRDFFVHDAVDSLTILPASLYDEGGVEVGRATLRFDPRTELFAMVRSFRPRLKLPRPGRTQEE